MNCDECMERISEYLDEELSQLECLEIKAHLECCPECRAMSNQFQSIHLNLVNAVNEIPVPVGLEERILLSLRHEQELTRKRVWLSGLILVVLGIPVLTLFSPLFLSLLRFLYTTTSVFLRTWPTLIHLVSPVLGIGLTLSVLFIAALGLYFLRSLLRGFRFNEVLS
ncbi:MAG: anti-sigma factor family protein [Desulfitobacteriaceae bacterium]